MLVEEMTLKIYKWQKRKKNNEKQNFTKNIAVAGGGCFLQGAKNLSSSGKLLWNGRCLLWYCCFLLCPRP